MPVVEGDLKIDLSWEAVDGIVISALKDARRNLIKDKKSLGRIFYDDVNEDDAEVQKHIDALTVVIKYFSV